jgi:hypothetical protein
MQGAGELKRGIAEGSRCGPVTEYVKLPMTADAALAGIAGDRPEVVAGLESTDMRQIRSEWGPTRRRLPFWDVYHSTIDWDHVTECARLALDAPTSDVKSDHFDLVEPSPCS